MIYKATELYKKLTSEQVQGHYFRGQIQEYPGPLWPSNYRLFFRSEDCLTIEDDSRLRKSGNRFHLRMNYIDWRRFNSQQEYNEFFLQFQLKDFVTAHTRNALGYPLSEAFFQQAGMRSEGLDVTDSVKIAFFFAIYEWEKEGYRMKQYGSEPCIIYRWYYDKIAWSFDMLNKYNYFNCPPLIPVKELLSLFGRCNTVEECEQSIEEYKAAINWDLMFFDLTEIQGRRPFELIKLPQDLVQNCRVAQQQASLLVPDIVDSADFLERHMVTSPQVAEELTHGVFVEDLAQNPTCERFYFDLESIEGLDWLEDLTPEIIFPKDDLLFQLLRGWMRSYIQNPFGMIPIFTDMPPDIDLGKFINLMLNDYETKFFI